MILLEGRAFFVCLICIPMFSQTHLIRSARRVTATLAASGVLCAAVLALMGASSAVAASPSATAAPAAPAVTTAVVTTTEVIAAQKGLAYITRTQNNNGTITFFTVMTSAGAVGDVAESIYAARALGVAPAQIVTAGKSLLDPLYSISATTYISGKVDRIGKFALAVAAANLDPRNFNGLDLVVSMTRFYSPTTSAFGNTNWDQSFGMLGLKAAGETVPVTATQLLASRIVSSGGFEFSPGFGEDTNSTGLVLQALVAGGQSITSTEVLSAVAYLKAAQVADGGWGYDDTATESDANSTSYVIQGLIAAGQDPFSTTWEISGTNPISFLLGEQQPDGGFVYLDPPSNGYATVQTIPALAGKAFPYASKAVSLRKGLAYLRTQQQADGGFGGFGVGDTLDVMNAIVAAGGQLTTFVSISGTTPISYLAAQTNYPKSSAAAAGKYLVGVVLGGGSPINFAGLNPVLSTTHFLSATTGRYGSSVWDQSWSILGLVAAGETILPAQVQQLISITATGGGYGFVANDVSAQADSTGLALMALHAAGVPVTSTVVQNSIAFLRQNQLADGGYGFGTVSDANTTGLALQGLAAYDEPTDSLTYAQVMTDGTTSRLILRTPVDAILNLQQADGSFSSDFGNLSPTAAALPGVAGRPLPLKVAIKVHAFFPVTIR